MSQSKERVLAVYPSAVCDVWGGWRDGEMGFTVRRRQMTYVEKLRDNALGTGESEAEAWDDAASKLPHHEPPSPAGEIASHDSYTCKDVHCGECHRESNIEGIRSRSAVPEPVPAEGAEETILEWSRRTAREALARGPYKYASAPEAAAAPENMPVFDRDMYMQVAAVPPERRTPFALLFKKYADLYFESAAPIAPADESTATSERLLRAINWAMGCGPDDFRSVRHDAPRFWWRSELAERAGLEYDGEKYVIRPTPPVREQP